MSKIAVGMRVQDNGGDRAWATIREILPSGRFTVTWDSGCVGEVLWHERDWLFDQPNDPRQLASPVRTETVTKRHIVPGVYGRLWVEGDATGYVSIALTSIDGGGRVGEEFRRSLSAPELRELARVALELAEYLESEQ